MTGKGSNYLQDLNCVQSPIKTPRAKTYSAESNFLSSIPIQKFVLKQAGIIGLTLPETGSPLGHSQLFWLTPPKYLL